MFSVKQKRMIADSVQKILRETNHPELPASEIQFQLHIEGTYGSWADIVNNAAATTPPINPTAK